MRLPIIAALAMAGALTLCGCHTTKHLTYLEQLGDSTHGTLTSSGHSVRIEPYDEMEIVVTSVVPSATAEYNLPATNASSGTALSEKALASVEQQTYIVNEDGNIDFPVLGQIHVAGLTTGELKSMLTKRISERVTDPMVRVRLINFKVNVMGEVRNPHTLYSGSERFSVLDAIAAAGDMTEYGRRDNVTVLREQGDSIVYQRLDLRDPAVVSSPFFYLKQNDVVIVEPNQTRQANARYNTNNSYKLSVISTIVSAVSVIASLVIALTVK